MTTPPPGYGGEEYDPLTDPLPPTASTHGAWTQDPAGGYGQQWAAPPAPPYPGGHDPLTDPIPPAPPWGDPLPTAPQWDGTAPDAYVPYAPPAPHPQAPSWQDPATPVYGPSPGPADPTYATHGTWEGPPAAAPYTAATPEPAPAHPDPATPYPGTPTYGTGDAPVPAGGRAARRRAAAESGGGRRGAGSAMPDEEAAPAASRLEARRAERARRPGPGVLLSRFIGESFITLGVLMLLFVAYQLWWTNVQAHQQASGTADTLQKTWDENPGGPADDAGTFDPGEGFAIMHIPELDVVVPVAEGIDKKSVLDRGMVGHYGEASGLPTAMPWDKEGNFAVAGHRNTHGEPFRYVNKLSPGDEIVVETEGSFYTYEMTRRLDSTSPANVSVLDPVPEQSGFTEPGRYLTLTTCTPEFTSTYRMIVWAELVDEQPRGEGKPAALS